MIGKGSILYDVTAGVTIAQVLPRSAGSTSNAPRSRPRRSGRGERRRTGSA